MSENPYNLASLFDQLGLPSSDEDIRAFITAHRPLPPGLDLSKAPFWTPAQAQFLGEETKDDANWVMVIDKFDSSLR